MCTTRSFTCSSYIAPLKQKMLNARATCLGKMFDIWKLILPHVTGEMLVLLAGICCLPVIRKKLAQAGHRIDRFEYNWHWLWVLGVYCISVCNLGVSDGLLWELSPFWDFLIEFDILFEKIHQKSHLNCYGKQPKCTRKYLGILCTYAYTLKQQ